MENSLYQDLFRQYLKIISTEEMISIVDTKINSGLIESVIFDYCYKSFYEDQNLETHLHNYFLSNRQEYNKIKVLILDEFIETLKSSKSQLPVIYSKLIKFIKLIKHFEKLSSNDTPIAFFEIIDDYELRIEGEEYIFKNLPTDLINNLERIKSGINFSKIE